MAESLDFSDLKQRYLDAQLRGDRREALRLLVDEGVKLGASVSDVQFRVVQEAQREIGRLWEEDRISIAEEHMATAISHLALAHLYQYAQPEAPLGRRVLIACVEGEQHEFPARLVADALDLAGFNVRFLGANVPTRSLTAMVVGDPPDLVALSVTMTFNLQGLRGAIEAIREATQGRVPIAVGGHACEWAAGLLRDLEVEITGSDAAALVDAAKAWFEEGR